MRDRHWRTGAAFLSLCGGQRVAHPLLTFNLQPDVSPSHRCLRHSGAGASASFRIPSRRWESDRVLNVDESSWAAGGSDTAAGPDELTRPGMTVADRQTSRRLWAAREAPGLISGFAESFPDSRKWTMI